jgi:hypothetical protein
MNLNNNMRIEGVWFQKTEKHQESDLIFAEVVFIIPANFGLLPQVFRFCRQIDNISSALQIHPDHFAYVGEMDSHDPDKKQIQLSNNTCCSYKFLMVLPEGAGTNELPGALWSLIEALKIRRHSNFSTKSDAKKHFLASRYQCKNKIPFVQQQESFGKMTKRFCTLFL